MTIRIHSKSAVARAAMTAVALLIAASAGAQSGIRRISSHHVSSDNPGKPHVETHLTVNPRDPNNLIATSMVVGDKGDMVSHTYVSFDGGRRWTRGRLAVDTTIVMEGDPLVYFSNTGTAFYVALGTVKGVNRTIVMRSTDGGRTWRDATVLSYADREWMAIDTTRGPFGGRLYFTGTGVTASRDSAGQRAVAPYFARSDDDGRTFPFRSFVGWERDGAPMNAVPLDPVVTTSGVLVMGVQSADQALVDLYRPDSLNPRRLGIIVSNDGGESFGQSRYSTTHRLTLTGSNRRRVRSNAATGYARVVVDASNSRFRNRIYIMSHSYDKALGRFVVLVWRTSDLGLTWQTTIASDAPAGDIANPAIAINRDGVVAVTWNDRRDGPERACFHTHAAISTDGGETFRPSQRLSTREACTNVPENWIAFGIGLGTNPAQIQTGASIPGRFANGGDTQGLIADATGIFHAAWISGETGMLQLWHSSFAVDLPAVARRDSATAPTNEVTPDVRFHVVDSKIDFASHVWTLTVRLENRSGRALTGPFRAEMVEFLHDIDQGGGLANLAVGNADSGGRGVGATWRFEAPNNILAPGARTNPRTLRFTFTGGVPDVVLGYLTPGFKVYAGP